MSLTKSLTRRRLNYQVVLFVLIALSSINWLLSLVLSVQINGFALPTFSTDQFHYILRAKQIWEGSQVTKAASSSIELKDGLTSHLEQWLFLLGPFFQSSDLIFTFYFIAIAIFSTMLGAYSFYLVIKQVSHSRTECLAIFSLFLLCTIWIDSRSLIESPYQVGIERWPTPSLHYALINFLLVTLIKNRDSLISYVNIFMLLSVSIYTYFYTWQIAFSMVIFFIIFGRQPLGLSRKKLLATCASAAIMGTPYFTDSILPAFTGEESQDDFYESEIGLIETRGATITRYQILGVGILAMLRFFDRELRSKNVYTLGCLLIATSILVTNQNIFTGLMVQPGHYHWFFTKPFITLFLIIVLILRIENKIFRIWLSRVAIVALMASVVLVMNNSFENFKKAFPSYLFKIEIEELTKNTFSFDRNTNYFVSANTSNAANTIDHMIYYKKSESSTKEFCEAEFIWRYNPGQTLTQKNSYRDLISCQALIKAFGEAYLGHLANLKHEHATKQFRMWLNKNGIHTLIIPRDLSAYQRFLLGSNWTQILKLDDVSVWRRSQK